MNAYYEVWKFTRERLVGAYEGMSDDQARWRPFEGAHHTLEHLYHLAGAEHWFASRLRGDDPHPDEARKKIDLAVRHGFITDDPFPFAEDEMSLEGAAETLEMTGGMIAPLLREPTPDLLEKLIETPLGPTVPGIGGLWRVAQHSAYHTGQIWMVRTSPGFPA